MKEFEIRTYKKSELAMMYFPNMKNADHAVRYLKRWIKNSPKLQATLEREGLNKWSKVFTPRQVQFIVLYLGEP